MKKLLAIAGTRPQVLKHSIFVVAAKKAGFQIKTIWTGQHWDYSLYGSFLKELHIPKPEYSLGIKDTAFGKRIGKMIDGITGVINDYKPDWVILYGDCDTTLAGALAARRAGAKIAHIESGYRSFDMSMPEEVNRIIVDEMSDLCFCATENCAMNLHVEGVRAVPVLTGDIMKDLLCMFEDKIDSSEIMATLGIVPREWYFATIHRAENTADKGKLKAIFTALKGLPLRTIFALHPRTEKKLREWGIYEYASKCVKFIPPCGYLDSLCLQKNAKKVITDSGTIQKESYILGTPVVTIRDTTEYPETMLNSCNVLCDDLTELGYKVQIVPGGFHPGLFGDGYSVVKMLHALGGKC